MSNIHSTAIIEEGAYVHASAQVGAYSIIETGAVIGERTIITSNVRIYGAVTMGAGNRIYHGAVIGCEPQDLSFTAEKSKPVIIGDNNIFREGVNISRGVKKDGTIIGDNNYFMNGFHLGHDSVVGNNCVFGTNSTMAGHVTIADDVFISGLAAVHQFTFIGSYAMVAGLAKIVKDVPPYAMADGNPARICGLNVVGLKRAGFPKDTRAMIKQAYKTIYHSGMDISHAISHIEKDNPAPEIENIISFFRTSQRGVTAHRKN